MHEVIHILSPALSQQTKADEDQEYPFGIVHVCVCVFVSASICQSIIHFPRAEVRDFKMAQLERFSRDWEESLLSKPETIMITIWHFWVSYNRRKRADTDGNLCPSLDGTSITLPATHIRARTRSTCVLAVNKG